MANQQQRTPGQTQGQHNPQNPQNPQQPGQQPDRNQPRPGQTGHDEEE